MKYRKISSTGIGLRNIKRQIIPFMIMQNPQTMGKNLIKAQSLCED